MITPDYDIAEALEARKNNDATYFTSTLPQAVGVATPDLPPPPSQRASWVKVPYPNISSIDVGKWVGDVLLPPEYPLLDPVWFDDPRSAFIDTAPDGTPSIEVRYGPGRPNEHFISSYFPQLRSFGRRRLGARCEVRFSNNWDWEALLTGGKVALGLWGGGRRAVGLRPPWVQDGVTIRNTWRRLAGGIRVNMYTYELNRATPEGRNSGGLTFNKWIPGQWQVLEYEGAMNTPGFADGFARMWIDSEPIAELRNAIWAINDEWAWRGASFQDAWQHGVMPASEQYLWVRNMAVYQPPLLDQGKRVRELVVVAVLNAIHSPSPQPPTVPWFGGTTDNPGAPAQAFGGTTRNPGNPVITYGGLS